MGCDPISEEERAKAAPPEEEKPVTADELFFSVPKASPPEVSGVLQRCGHTSRSGPR